MKKYEFTGETKNIDGHILHRIRALRDIYCGGWRIRAGDLGGWIESEKNLSQEGNAWVGGSATVCENVQVYDSAWVYGNAQVCDSAQIYGDAEVYGNAQVGGDARVSGDARVCGNVWVYDSARVYGNAQVYDSARVCGDARVCGNAQVYDSAQICGDAEVYGNAWVYGNAQVCDSAWVGGNAEVDGNAWVGENAQVYRISDIFEIRHIGSRNDTTTFFRTQSKQIHVKCGCFSGTIDEFETKVKATHKDNVHAKTYTLAIQMAKLKLGGD